MASVPTVTKALILCKSESTSEGDIYHDVVLASRPLPTLKPGEILVKVTAVAFNRRDLWLRLGQYPGITFDRVMGSDGVGENLSKLIQVARAHMSFGVGQVIASSDPNDDLLQKRIFFVPMRGWESDPDAPEAESVSFIRLQLRRRLL